MANSDSVAQFKIIHASEVTFTLPIIPRDEWLMYIGTEITVKRGDQEWRYVWTGETWVLDDGGVA